MELNRFFKIYITSPDGATTYAVDGTVPGLGIVAGTMKLHELLCDSELAIGAYTSNKFEVQIYGLSDDVGGYDIVVYNEPSGGEIEHIFTGKIDSSKADKYNGYRAIVAYDAMYWVRDVEMREYWQQFWSINRQATLRQLRTSMCAYVGLSVADHQVICANDDYLFHADSSISPADIPDNTLVTIQSEPVITSNSTESVPQYVIVQAPSNTSSSNSVDVDIVAPADMPLTFSELLRMICEMQACCPNMTRDGKIEFVRMATTYAIAHTVNYEANNTTFQDYETDKLTGYVVYDASNKLLQTVVSAENPIMVVGNIFLLAMTTDQISRILGNAYIVVQYLRYTPAKIPLIVSDLTIKLGDAIRTVRDNTTSYCVVLSQIFSGPQLVNQTIDCPAYGKKLNSRASSVSASTARSVQLAQMQQELTGVSTRVGQVVDESGNIDIQDTWSAHSGVAVNSDRNNKNTIKDIDESYSKFFDNLRPVVFKYNDGTSDRLHVGFIAQEVEDALSDSKIPTKDFGGYITLTRNGKTVCGLRYEEFIALNTREIQKLKGHIAELENKIAELQNKIKGE